MYCSIYSIISFITPFISFVIRFVHLIFPAAFFVFAFYINIVVIVIDSIVNIIIVTTGIFKNRFIVDLCKRELYFVIYKGLESFKDYNIIRYLVSVCQVEIQLDIDFLNPSK